MAKRDGDGRADAKGGGRGGRRREDGVRIGKQTVRFADRQAVPAARLELAREPAGVGARHRRRSHPPELCTHDGASPRSSALRSEVSLVTFALDRKHEKWL